MKKIILSMIGLLAATAFAPQASAIPSFARQTGMACLACHQQHFPVLNPFGQSFKANGYTMMGSQGLVEGEHIALPDTLNGSMLLKARYQKAGGGKVDTDNTYKIGTLSGQSTRSGEWQVPDEFSLFFGGRVAEFAGFMFEGNTAASALVAGLKVPMVADLGAVKVLAIPYLTDALGASYGFEQASTGAVRGVRWAEHRKDISAQQYLNTDGAATGLAFVAVSDMGYINVSRWSPNFAAFGRGDDRHAGAIQLTSNYIRVAATPTVADWAMHIGVQSWSGENYQDNGTNPGGTGGEVGAYDKVKTEATALDFQAFGKLGENDLAIYATYGTIPKADTSATAVANAFGEDVNAKTAMSIGADYSVIPHVLTVGAAVRVANNGSDHEADNGVGSSDNAVTLAVVYDLAQNVALHVNYSAYSGSAYNAATTTWSADGLNSGKIGAKKDTSLVTTMLEAAW